MLLVDNFDSFTFNLAQALGALGADVRVHRNDAVDVELARGLRPTHLMISPGPGRPEDAGASEPILRWFLGRIPVLGVCLGHQLLAQVHGARVVVADELVHGKASAVLHDGRTLFEGLSSPTPMARYHSLVVEESSLPEDFEVSARTASGMIMGLRHLPSGAEGVQFHPESVLSPEGPALLARFLASG
ncbi:MAG: aminodeoxychorismate/anthranilate synthase component II [Myxococcales bacterium]|nr:aminodeoxychorismate/anthranilate synthase component II [Myxococcales bacterium]